MNHAGEALLPPCARFRAFIRKNPSGLGRSFACIPQTTSATSIEGNLEFEDEPHRYSCKLASIDRTPERTTGDHALCR